MINTKVVSRPDIIKKGNEISKTVEVSIVKLIKSGAKYLQSIVPVKTGELKKSINWDENGIWSTAEHYKYVDEGTKPHKITGNPFLAFQINGANIVVRSVNHPGTKPRNLTNKTEDYINNNINDIVKDINKVI